MNVSLNFSPLIISAFVVGFSFKLGAQVNDPSLIQPEDLFSRERILSSSGENLSLLLSEVEKRSKELDSREAALAISEARQIEKQSLIEKKIEELTRAEESLRQAIGQAKNSAKNDIETVVALYERMKPKQAANIFELMDLSLASGLLARMKPEVASGILSGLSAEKSYAISVYLSGRNVE